MSDLNALEDQLEINKAQAKKAEAIERLLRNPDFRAIILDDFCRDEVVRNMNMAGNLTENLQMRADCLHAAYAGGHLKRYLIAQQQMGLNAEHGIPALEAEIADARFEEDSQ